MARDKSDFRCYFVLDIDKIRWFATDDFPKSLRALLGHQGVNVLFKGDAEWDWSDLLHLGAGLRHRTWSRPPPAWTRTRGGSSRTFQDTKIVYIFSTPYRFLCLDDEKERVAFPFNSVPTRWSVISTNIFLLFCCSCESLVKKKIDASFLGKALVLVKESLQSLFPHKSRGPFMCCISASPSSGNAAERRE